MPSGLFEWMMLGLTIGVIVRMAQIEELPAVAWGAVALGCELVALQCIGMPYFRVLVGGVAAYGLMAIWTIYVRKKP
jgi:hypothetical protein